MVVQTRVATCGAILVWMQRILWLQHFEKLADEGEVETVWLKMRFHHLNWIQIVQWHGHHRPTLRYRQLLNT